MKQQYVGLSASTVLARGTMDDWESASLAGYRTCPVFTACHVFVN